MVIINKLKRFNLLELSVAILGFSLITLLVFACFYERGAYLLGFLEPQSPSKFGGEWKVRFLDENGDGCDVFDGKWVFDESYPLYNSQNCLYIDEGFRCLENGRPDSLFTKWRWQPHGCNLPRFNATTMLEKLRNKRLVFVGDSIGRNQWESLLCMLSSVVTNSSSIYEINGNPITKHKGFLAFMFKDYNCSVEYYRAPFLMLQGRPPIGSPEIVKTTIKIDKLDWSSIKWRDADVLVFNSGHWWNYAKTVKSGSYFQEGEEVKMNMSVEMAYLRSLETVISWVRDEVNMSKTRVFFRTYAPVHSRKSRGKCNFEKLPIFGSLIDESSTSSVYQTFFDVLSQNSNRSHMNKWSILNVTKMTALRKDGHSSLYYLTPKDRLLASLKRQDCSHWCLPGVPDSWNELLYAVFLKQELIRARNQTF